MKTTKKCKNMKTGGQAVTVRMHGFSASREQFDVMHDFEMAAGFYDHQDSWNKMLLNTMSNMRVSCQFFH